MNGDALLTAPADLAEINLNVDVQDYYAFNVELKAERNGTVHGLLGWFEAELADGIWMTNAPTDESPIDRHQVFLAIDKATKVTRGEVIKATIMTRPQDHLLAWTVALPSQSKSFGHSTWHSPLISQAELYRVNPMHVPMLTPEGRARAIVLGYCDGKRTAAEIQAAVTADHPQLLPGARDVNRFVAQVLGKDTQ